MKTKALILSTILTVMSLISFSQNDKRFGFELNAGASFATQKLAGAELDPGFGFEGILQYRFFNNISVIAGWGWNGFSADESFAGSNMDFEETGYIMGLQYCYPLPDSKISLFARGSALYNHIEIENEDGDIIHDTGHGWGWQAAAGVNVPLGKNWILTPGIKFNSLSRDLDMSEYTTTLDQKYLSARVGITKKF